MRRPPLPGARALLLGAALALHAAPGEARLVRPNEPAAPVAERGGQSVPPRATPGRRACAWGFDAGFLLPFGFGLPCLDLQQVEAMTRMAVGLQQAMTSDRREWRAPRLVDRVGRPRRAAPRDPPPRSKPRSR